MLRMWANKRVENKFTSNDRDKSLDMIKNHFFNL